MLGNRLKKAEEIAKRRAARLAREEPHVSTDELEAVSPPSKDDRQHKDARYVDEGCLRKWNGSCSCPACKDAKRRRYKGQNKRQWKEMNW